MKSVRYPDLKDIVSRCGRNPEWIYTESCGQGQKSPVIFRKSQWQRFSSLLPWSGSTLSKKQLGAYLGGIKGRRRQQDWLMQTDSKPSHPCLPWPSAHPTSILKNLSDTCLWVTTSQELTLCKLNFCLQFLGHTRGEFTALGWPSLPVPALGLGPAYHLQSFHHCFPQKEKQKRLFQQYCSWH